MAKVNPVKVKQDADREEKAGRLDKAVQLYRQLLDDNPRDWNTINKIGDLYARMNRMQEAASEYAKVADFYARDGFHLKAIAIWKKINKLDASSLDPYMKLADLYAKQGLMMEAKGQYQVVVDEFIKRGRTKDAGEVLRKLAEIDPGDLKLRSRLADLYTREGQVGKAINEMVAIADELNRKGHLAEAVQVLEKGLKIDSSSTRLRGELARAYLVQKNFAKAAEILEQLLEGAPDDAQALAQLGEAYLASNRVEDAEKAFKRLVQISPDNPDTRVQVARLLLAQGKLDAAYEELVPVVDRLIDNHEAEKAATLLQQVVQRAPGHVKTLCKLVDLYRQLKNDHAVSSTYTQLTESYIKAGELEQAASILEMLISMEPSNQQHQTKLAFVRGKMGPSRASAAASSEDSFGVSNADVALAFAEEPLPPAARAPMAPPQQIVPSGPLSEEDKEFIEEHLAEGKVFRKYGLIDKASDQFEAVIARFADHLETRQELLDVLKEKGQPTKAAEQALAIAQIYKLQGDLEAAEAALDEARRLAPELVPALEEEEAKEPEPAAGNAARDAEPEAALEVSSPAAEEFGALPAEEAALSEADEDISLAEAEEDIPLEVEESGLDTSEFDAVDEPPPAEEAPEAFAEQSLDSLPEERTAPFEIGGSGLEITTTRLALDEGAGDGLSFEPEAFALDVPEQAPGEDEPAPEAAAPPSVVEPPAAAAPAAAPPAAPLQAAPLQAAPAPAAPPHAASVPAELHKVLEEVESYVSLGFVDDAKDLLRELGQKYPGHPAIAEKTAELGIDLGVEPEEEPAAAVFATTAVPPEMPEAALPPDAADAEPSFAAGTAGEPIDLGADLDQEASEPPAPFDELAELGSTAAEPEQAFSTEPEQAFAADPAAAADQDRFHQAPAVPEGGIDLGAELNDLFSVQSTEEPQPKTSSELDNAGLADIFDQFRKGVDKQLGKEDYDTRYNLGIAYKEMGLIDEAIAEFQLAAKDELRLLECSSMLGICFMDKGMPKLAVKWFEKGLRAPNRSSEEYQGLRYDLAMAHEASGERDKALNLFEGIYGQDAGFRDVAQKVRELRAQP